MVTFNLTTMTQAIKFVTTPFIEIYEEIFKQPTLGLKILQSLIFLWVTGLFLLFVVGWTTLVVAMIIGKADFSNATFGVFDYL